MENYGIDRFNFVRNNISKLVDIDDSEDLSIEKLIAKRKENDTTYFEKLDIGDKVIIKRLNQCVIVTDVDFKVDGVKYADYAGVLCDTNNSNKKVLFGQDDILGKKIDTNSKQR